MNKSNICVVGTGYWGSNHLRSLKELGILGGFVEENNETLSDVMTRYDTYMKKTEPVLKFYSSKSYFHEIDGNQKIDVITGKIEQILTV